MDAFPAGGGGMGGAAPAEEDFSSMPIEERLKSKLWKARVSAYEELVRAFSRTASDDDPIFRTYARSTDALRAMVLDSNAVAQEKGVDSVRAFLEFGGKTAGSTRSDVLPAIVEKCLGSSRAGTKKLATEVALLYVENENVMGSEGVVLDLLKGTEAKQPKSAAASVSALKEAVRLFGPKQVSPKHLLKKLPDIFGHSDKTVRAEAGALAIELHRWIGAALEPTLAALKDIQAKELRAQFESAGDAYTLPERHLLSQKAAAAGASASIGAATAENPGAGQAEEPVDPLEFADPVNPLSSKEWPADFEDMVVSKKWQERKETLDTAAKVFGATPKILYSPALDAVVDALVERVRKDLNINVVLTACQCLTLLAKGLRNGFAKYKDKALPPLLEKLKERKESTVKVLAECCDAIFQTVSFSEVLEDIFAATKHKNPAVKTESIRFLVRCLAETRTMPAKGDIKPIAESLVQAMSDGSADVRDAGAQGLGTLMKLVGERPMTQFLESLDDIKKGKVQDQFKIATVKVKAGTAPVKAGGANAPPRATTGGVSVAAPKAAVPKLAATSAAAKTSPASPGNKENAPPSPGKPAAKPPARLTAKKPALGSSAPKSVTPAAPAPKPSVAAAATRPAGKGAMSATEPVKYRFSAEDAEARAAELIPEAISALLASSNWKERLQGMTDLNAWLDGEASSAESEVVARALGKKPGWKESNFQVLGEVYKALRKLAEDSPTFGRPTVALSVQPLCDKLGDVKLKGAAGETLTLYAEKTSFGFVLSQALVPLGNLKAPKAIADSLLWIDQSLLEFGTSGVDVRGIIDHLVSCLKSANAAVRTNATQCIGTLARFLGTALTTFLGDLNPQLRTTVDAEIEKAASNPAPAPTRFASEGRAPAGGKSGGAAGGGTTTGDADGGGVDEDALDALIPRVDIDRIIPASAVARLSDSNWKERKEGLEEIQAILEANKRLKPSSMSDLVGPLKMRYADSNLAVRTLALDVISRIATGMNKGFEPHVRTFVPPITQVLADAKAPIRASASAALTAIAEQVGVGAMISSFGSVLDGKGANPTLRQDLFSWLAAWFEEHPPQKPMDLAPLALSAVQCLDDKLAAVRKAAQACLPYIIMRAGYKFVSDQANLLKAASRNSVLPMIDAARAQAAAMAKATGPVAASAPVAAASTTPAIRAGSTIAKRTSIAPPAAGSSIAPSSPKRSQSPAPTLIGSARTSTLTRTSGMKPPSAVGRSLRAPSGLRNPTSLNSSDELDGSGGSSDPPVSGFKSRLAGPASKIGAAVSARSGVSSSPAADRPPPFISADPKFKSQRERKEGRGLQWIGAEGTPRPELLEVLRSQCEHHLSADLVESMFSKDHNAERDYLSALTLLSDYISSPTFAEEEFGLSQSEAVARSVANSDLVFKYIAIRLTDNNTSISLKCLDILYALVDLLRAEQYHMSDYEASAILPCLIAKFGDAKVAFRDRIRSVFRRLVFIFPPSKLLALFIEHGLPSKNARTRMECLTEIGHLFSKNGLQVCTPAKTLPIIAKSIADRDANVRTAALMTIGEAYKIVTDDIWKLVGILPAKDMSLLEERLKRTSIPGSNPVAAPAMAPGPRSSIVPPSAKASAGLSRIARPSSVVGGPTGIPSGIPAAGVKSRLPSVAGSGIARASHRSVSAASESSSVATRIEGLPPTSDRVDDFDGETIVESDSDFGVEQIINEILSSDEERSVTALKSINQRITDMEPALPRHIDQLAIVLSKQLHRAFSSLSHDDHARLKKHLLITGTNIFDPQRIWDDERTLGAHLARPALVSLLTELLQRLIETSSLTDEQGMAQTKYLNVMVLRSFSSCDLNTLFGACLLMLGQATEDLPELEGEILEKRSKFAELIVKCLWKVARRLPDSLREPSFSTPQLMLDLENFLQLIPPPKWRQRAAENVPLQEVPLRTVKVILTNVVTTFGEDSLDMLDLLPEPEQSHVYHYLVRMCNKDGKSDRNSSATGNGDGLIDEDVGDGHSRPLTPAHATLEAGARSPPLSTPRKFSNAPARVSGDKGATTASSALTSPRSSAGNGEDSAINAELRAIFDRIAIKDESRAAIRDLYEFQKRYPSKTGMIDKALNTTGPIFQRYIKRALANHAAEDDEPGEVLASTTQSEAPQSPSARSSLMSSTRNSVMSSAGGGELGSTTAPASPGHDERLAALRAKFAKSSDRRSGASQASS